MSSATGGVHAVVFLAGADEEETVFDLNPTIVVTSQAGGLLCWQLMLTTYQARTCVTG